MANYKLIDIDKLNDLINEIKDYYNHDNSLKYVLEDLQELIKGDN